MTLAPSWEEQEEGRRRAAAADARAALLARLADHVAAPSEETWQALLGAARGLDGAEAAPFAGMFGVRAWADRIGEVAEGLIRRDPQAWARFYVDELVHGGSATEGGARLKALSPYAGKAVVAVIGGRIHGETALLVGPALRRAGLDPDGSYYLALGPDALTLAPDAPVNPPPADPGR